MFSVRLKLRENKKLLEDLGFFCIELLGLFVDESRRVFPRAKHSVASAFIVCVFIQKAFLFQSMLR